MNKFNFLKGFSLKAWLYNLGNEFVSLTGGWSSRGWMALNGINSMATVSLTKNADHMLLAGSGTNYASFVAELGTDIDLTSYKTLTVVLNNVAINTNAEAGNTVKIAVVPRSATYWIASAVAQAGYADTLSVDQSRDIDVTPYNGSYDIIVGVYNSKAAGCQIKVVSAFLT
jgi:hypothetical protein